MGAQSQHRDVATHGARKPDTRIKSKPSLPFNGKSAASDSTRSRNSALSCSDVMPCYDSYRDEGPSENEVCSEEERLFANENLPALTSSNSEYSQDAICYVHADSSARYDCSPPSTRRTRAGLRDQDALLCSEQLNSAARASFEATSAPKPGACVDAIHIEKLVASNPDLLAMIRNEKDHELELLPTTRYLEHHNHQQNPSSYITPQMRTIVVSWLVEVACEYRLQQETLYLAVALTDRFLSFSSALPRNMLQLVAVTCVLVAAKQEEVVHPTVEELTDISANCFKKEDLLRLEVILLDALNWRIKTPTSYSFLHLFSQGLFDCSPQAISLAAYYTELAMLDYTFVKFPPSMIAAAALYLAFAHVPGQNYQATLQLLSGYSPAAVEGCMQLLLELHHCSRVAETVEAYQPMLSIREKYSQACWYEVSTLQPITRLA